MENIGPFQKLAWYAAMLCASAGCIAVGLGLSSGWPPPAPLLVLGALVCFSTHRVLVVAEGVDFSPSIAVCMAGVVVFEAAGTPSGAVIVGLAAGVYFPVLRRSTWGWIPFNAGVNGLGVAAATLVYSVTAAEVSHELPGALIAIVPAAVAALVVVAVLIALSFAVDHTQPVREASVELLRQQFGLLPFAILGFFLGELYLDVGAAIVLLMIVPIIIAREMYASYVKVKEAHDETVQMLMRALEKKDTYTAGHAERVAGYACYLGQEFGFGPARMERLRFAALMHDIGKLIVPNHILNKPGRLTEAEFARVRMHERVSVQMLSHIDFLRPIAGIALPDAMKFDPNDSDHPVEPYIIMVADAYDAMTSTRAYRKALSQEVAFAEMRTNKGTQFHPACVEAFIYALERRGEAHGAGYEAHPVFLHAPDVGPGSAGLGDLLPSQA